MTVKLTREQSLDTIGLLISLSIAAKTWFKVHDPAYTRANELAGEILKQSIEKWIITDQELEDTVRSFNVKDIDINV